MEGNADFQSGFNLIICYYAIGEHEKMRRGFTNLISIPMESLGDEEDEEDGKDADNANGGVTELKVVHLKRDGLKAVIRQRQKKATEYMLTAAKLCAPALDKKDWITGYNWVIDTLKQDHESIASEM